MSHDAVGKTLAATVIATGLLLAGANDAIADPIKCQRGIVKESAKYVQSRSKVLQSCEESKARGALRATIACTSDPLTTPLLGVLAQRLTANIANVCGGSDRTCGTADDDPLGTIGWDAVPVCPDMQWQGCSNAIADCSDVGVCLRCVADVAVDHAIALYYDALVADEFGSNTAINKCQLSIGKATAKFLAAKSKALAKCWDARLQGRHANPCPMPGDGRAPLAIQRADAKRMSTICAACGGSDGLCDGMGDVTPAQIGFAAVCPSVTPPGGRSCEDGVVDASDLAVCTGCVTEFDVDCVGAVAVPQFMNLAPGVCNPGPVPPMSSTTSSTIAASTTSTTAAASTSTTRSSTTSTTTTSSTLTTSTTPPVVIEFTLLAGSGNAGQVFRDPAADGPPSQHLAEGFIYMGNGGSTLPAARMPEGGVNRFTARCAGSICTIGPITAPGTSFDCSDTGCRLGPPMPLINAGLSACLENTFAEAAAGTYDSRTRDVEMDIRSTARVVLTANAAQPCPVCRTQGGTGAPCAGSPTARCRGYCDTGPNKGKRCKSRNSSGLTGDCPSPHPTVGEQRCYGGTNDGAVCVTASGCGGGTCAQFLGDVRVDLTPATTKGASMVDYNGMFCPGQPHAGAFFGAKICDRGPNVGLECTSHADCQESGARCASRICAGGSIDGLSCFFPGDCPGGWCTPVPELARHLRVEGLPLSGSLFPLGTEQTLRLASTFCIPATTNGVLNRAAGFPGPGVMTMRGTVRVVP